MECPYCKKDMKEIKRLSDGWIEPLEILFKCIECDKKFWWFQYDNSVEEVDE